MNSKGLIQRTNREAATYLLALQPLKVMRLCCGVYGDMVNSWKDGKGKRYNEGTTNEP